MTGKTLLIGSGACAHRIAADILAKESDMIIASTGEDFGLSPAYATANKAEELATVCSNTKVISCQGTVGDFRVALDRKGEKQIAAVDQVIIAEDEQRIPKFSAYGLTRTNKVMEISRFKKLLFDSSRDRSQFSGMKTVVFLVGLDTESNPILFEEVMQSCLKLPTDYTLKTYILTGNLKVAADGLEKLYRETKKAGVVYIKFTDTRPDILQAADGGVCIEFTDEITGLMFRLKADLTIVDERIVPSDYAADLARIFKLDKDLNGFAQSDNVHRLTVLTNRRGILVAGPSRSVLSVSDRFIDADNTLLALRKNERHPADRTADKALIENGKCVRCLTCYRLCPYRAIQVNTRVSIAPEACEGCGICLAECPRGAISIEKQKTAVGSVMLSVADLLLAEDSFMPSITAFCCSRSAACAAALAVRMGKPLPPGLRTVEVPCGGSVSLNHILTAFKSNADGVLVLTCHDGNCHSEQGPVYAGQRVEQITDLFKSIGLESGRLIKKTLASNMGTEFATALIEFEKQLLKMGPNRLKT